MFACPDTGSSGLERGGEIRGPESRAETRRDYTFRGLVSL
jgi:hypothetical protein